MQMLGNDNFFVGLRKLNPTYALDSAKSFDDDHIFWKLGLYCESQQKFSEALNSYQEIPENNPHYQEANYRAAHLIMQYLNTVDEEEQDLTSDEKRQYQESEFRFLLRANQDTSNQRLVDQTFHQLCEGKDLNPSITGVKPDEDTLVALAQQTSLLRKDNLLIRQKNKLLMDEIATLKQRLAKSTNNESTYKQGLFNNTAKTITKDNADTYCGLKAGF